MKTWQKLVDYKNHLDYTRLLSIMLAVKGFRLGANPSPRSRFGPWITNEIYINYILIFLDISLPHFQFKSYADTSPELLCILLAVAQYIHHNHYFWTLVGSMPWSMDLDMSYQVYTWTQTQYVLGQIQYGHLWG